MSAQDLELDRLFDPGASGQLDAYLRLLHPSDIAELFHHVAERHWRTVAQRLAPEVLAEVMTDLDEPQRVTLGTLLQTDRLIRVVEELETDDAADVIADLPEDKSEAVLEAVEDGDEIRVLLAYPEDSAGGIMQTELCRVREGARVADAIEAVRRAREQLDDVLEVYVVDRKGRLTGVVDLEDLLVSNETAVIDSLRQPVEQCVTPTVDQEQVALIFGKYDVPTLPVVNDEGVLLGRITFDDVHDVMEEEASEDIMAMAGASAGDLVYGGNVVRIAMFRLPWLTSSLIGSLATGYMLQRFGSVAADTLVMMAFVPVVMAMTGNVGTQSAMIVTRGFAIGKIDFSMLRRTFLREVSVGMVMGLVAGTIVGTAAQVWRGNPGLGIVVTAAMTCSMTLAAIVGVAAPSLFKRIGVDPAIAAGPLVTTGCDLMGISIYLCVSLLLLG